MLPALEKLRRERASYLEWQAACSEAEALGHVILAHRYWTALQGAESGAAGIARVEAQIAEVEARCEELEVRAGKG